MHRWIGNNQREGYWPLTNGCILICLVRGPPSNSLSHYHQRLSHLSLTPQDRSPCTSNQNLGGAGVLEVFTLIHVIHMDSTGLQWTPLDSSGPLARPDWLVQCPVQSTGPTLDCKPLFRVQSQSSGLWVQSESRGVQWNPGCYLLLIINTTKKAKLED